MKLFFQCRPVVIAFLLFQVWFLSNRALARPPDPLVFPSGEVRSLLSADRVNQELIDQGRATATTRPFTPGSTVYEIRIAQDLALVWTYLRDPGRLKEGSVGSWLMSATTIRGLSPAQVRDIYALPALNDYLTTVRVPAGTVIRTGSAGPITGWGDGGGQQVLLITRLPVENYEFQRTLVDQTLLFSTLATGGNAGAAAVYIDHLPPPVPYSDWSLVNLLLGYLTPGPLQRALRQIGPGRFDTLTQLDIRNTVGFLSALQDRRRNRLTATSSRYGEEKPSNINIETGTPGSLSFFTGSQDRLCYWAQGSGAFGHQDSSGDHVGYQYQSGSYRMGADYRVEEKIFLGTGLSLARTGFSWADNLGDGNINQINLGLYGGLSADPFFLDGVLTGGVRRADISRGIRFPGVDRLATSSPEGYNVAVRLIGGVNHCLSGWDLQPAVRMDLIYVAQDAFSENGADSLNLQVGRYNSWTWRGELGIRLARTFICGNRLKLIPDLWLGWGYQTPLDNRTLEASLSGQPGRFMVNGLTDPKGSFLPSLGITAQGWGKVSLFLRYEGDFCSDYTSQTVNAGLRIPF